MGVRMAVTYSDSGLAITDVAGLHSEFRAGRRGVTTKKRCCPVLSIFGCALDSLDTVGCRRAVFDMSKLNPSSFDLVRPVSDLEGLLKQSGLFRNIEEECGFGGKLDKCGQWNGQSFVFVLVTIEL